MAGRRAIPDNLDPLVDTLSNVVGILVVVVALTQIQLGDAIDRIAEMSEAGATALEEAAARGAVVETSLMARQDALFRRTDGDVEAAIALARETLEKLDEVPDDAIGMTTDLEAERRLKNARGVLAQRQEARNRRAEFRASLEAVPKQMVARLPDPTIVRGKESWILLRYGRAFLVDRERLFDEGSNAIQRVLADAVGRPVRADEFEAVSRYLRKTEIGFGSFRWLLKTEPQVRVELAWRNKDTGINRTELATSRALRAWLAVRSPESDVIKFQVWSDSFETYLEARQVVEAAGFQAGWRGFEEDQELILRLSFGVPNESVRRLEVD